jgi:hypothetical protein
MLFTLRSIRNDQECYRLTTITTPWSRVFPEKLTVPQLVKKFLVFYKSRRFVTAFTTARHLSLDFYYYYYYYYYYYLLLVDTF